MQVADDVAPDVPDDVPAAQATHPAPLVEKYPTGQEEHESEEKQDVPAMHVTVHVPEQSS